MNFNQILAEYGIPGLAIIAAIAVIILAARVVYLASKALFERSNSDTKQDDTIRELLVSLNKRLEASEERERGYQRQSNHTNAELADVKVKLGGEEGRRIEIKETMQREREEWKAERAEWQIERSANTDKFSTLETRILDLEKNQRDNQAKIRELEAQIDTLNKRIVSQDGEIVSLRAIKLQLETEKAQLLELNTELRKQVDEHSARVDNLSQLVKLGNEADFIPTTLSATPVPTDNTQSIPDMRDVDDTFYPLSQAGTIDKPNTDAA